MKQKICHIRLNTVFGGAERQAYMLIKELRPIYEVTVLVVKDSVLAGQLRSLDGIKLIEAPWAPRWRSFIPPWSLAFRPYCVYRLKDFALLHAHEWPDAKVAYLARRVFGIPYVLSQRGDKLTKMNRKRYKLGAAASVNVAVSEAGQRVLNGAHSDVETVSIPDSSQFIGGDSDKHAGAPINTQRVRQIRALYPGKFVIGHIARLANRDKGQEFLIRVARRFYDEGFRQFHFLFIGEGESRKKLQKLSGGYPNIEFTGFKDNIGDYYRALDLFVFPSISEGLGSAILDAFALKVPVVASDTGGIPDLVKHERTGLLHDIRDESQIYEAILRMYSDEKLRAEVVKNAYSLVQKYSIKCQAEQYSKVYDTVLGAKKRGFPSLCA